MQSPRRCRLRLRTGSHTDRRYPEDASVHGRDRADDRKREKQGLWHVGREQRRLDDPIKAPMPRNRARVARTVARTAARTRGIGFTRREMAEGGVVSKTVIRR